jgi:hypothetical protein
VDPGVGRLNVRQFFAKATTDQALRGGVDHRNGAVAIYREARDAFCVAVEQPVRREMLLTKEGRAPGSGFSDRMRLED